MIMMLQSEGTRHQNRAQVDDLHFDDHNERRKRSTKKKMMMIQRRP